MGSKGSWMVPSFYLVCRPLPVHWQQASNCTCKSSACKAITCKSLGFPTSETAHRAVYGPTKFPRPFHKAPKWPPELPKGDNKIEIIFVVTLYHSLGSPMGSQGSPMGPHGPSIGFAWVPHGSSMGSPWAPMGPPWVGPGIHLE